MYQPRVLPVLLLKNDGLVKTKNFKDPVYIGDPINAVRIFNEKEVDELILLDITATAENRDPNFKWIRDIVSESFMPVGYGGGIKNLQQVQNLFDSGIEKIVINSAADDYKFISDIANRYGNQSIVISIDARKSLLGKYSCYTQNGSKNLKIEPSEFAKNVVDAGAGEIIIQNIANEGSMTGIDLNLIKKVCESVDVPVVATGGAGNIDHIKDAIQIAGASAVAAGSMFVFKGRQRGILINYPVKNLNFE